MKKIILTMAIISLIFIAVIFPILTFGFATSESIEIEYKVTINNNQTSEYKVYIPMPTNDEIVKKTKGSAEYSIIKTEYGNALMIESSEDVSFKGNFKKSGSIWFQIDWQDYYLTLGDDYEWHYWIYVETKDSIFVDIAYSKEIDNPAQWNIKYVKLNYTLNNGWTKVNNTADQIPHGDKFGINLLELCVFVIAVDIIIVIIAVVLVKYYIKQKKPIDKDNNPEEKI